MPARPDDPASSESPVVADATVRPLPPPFPPAGADAAGRPAAVRIQDMRPDDRPRERLSAHGPSALSDAELLALFFRTGMQGLSAIDIGRELIARHKNLTAIGRLSLHDLQRQRGLGPAKAMDLMAAVELGRRLARTENLSKPMDNPEAVLAFVGPEMRAESNEVLKVILVNTRLAPVGVENVSRGTLNETLAHPRDILRHVLLHNAFGFILTHNHPSGDPQPSAADMQQTRRLREAAELMQVRFLDHIIVGQPTPSHAGYFSFREAGVM